MTRTKETFKQDINLQNEVLHDRIVNCLTIKEISEKYPKYSKYTYMRFFKMVLSKEENLQIEKKIRVRNRDEIIRIQKELWLSRSQEFKNKQIAHCKKLAEGQRK